MKTFINKFLIAFILLVSIMLPVVEVSAKEVDDSNNAVLLQDVSVLDGNGKYEVPIFYNIKSNDSLSNKAILEKDNDTYYLTITILNNKEITHLILINNNATVGTMINKEGNKTNYTFTLDEDSIESGIVLEAYNKYDKKDIDITISADLNNAHKVSNKIDDLGERPALYVPNVFITPGETDLKSETYCTIRNCKAFLMDKPCDVTVSVYYTNGDKVEDVEITNNQFYLKNIGDYHIVYHAESDLYKTSLGHNTFNDVEIIVHSSVKFKKLIKVEPLVGKELPEGLTVQSVKASKDSKLYAKVQKKLAKVSDHFEVISYTLYDKDGLQYIPDEDFTLYISPNNEFDLNKVSVYHIGDDGQYVELKCKNTGEYLKTETNLTGVFVIAVNGVLMDVPTWMYAVITAVAVIVLVSAVATTFIVINKRKRVKLGH